MVNLIFCEIFFMVDINEKQRGLRCPEPEARRAPKGSEERGATSGSDLCPQRALGADETDLHPCWEGESGCVGSGWMFKAVGCV